MTTQNQKWTKGTNVKDADLKCECGKEKNIVHCSNWHDGTGIFYCACECGKESNVRWEEKAEYCNEYGEDFNYDDFDEDDWREEMEERRQEELAERAALCKCGAWQFAKDGSVIHVADCCCDAE